MKRLTDTHRQCVIEATIDPLVSYRRGFARTKDGPFFAHQLVRELIKAGALRSYYTPNGRRDLHVSARAA